jgi:hypothetical protein
MITLLPVIAMKVESVGVAKKSREKEVDQGLFSSKGCITVHKLT